MFLQDMRNHDDRIDGNDEAPDQGSQYYDMLNQMPAGDDGAEHPDKDDDDDEDEGDAGNLLDDEADLPRLQGDEDQEVDLNKLASLVKLDSLKTSLGFIQLIRDATLEDGYSNLDAESLHRLRNPRTEPIDVSDPSLRLAIDLFSAISNSAQETYTTVRNAILRRYPDDDLFSYDQIKRRIAEITGIVPIMEAMCINSCIAYTGLWKNLPCCPECGEPCNDPVSKKPRQEFHTMPIGPQIQAMRGGGVGAEELKYRLDKTTQVMEELLRKEEGAILDQYDDFLDGSEYTDAVRDGRIKPDDIVLMLSIDGAQLYAMKASDCWIYIWIVFDLSPGARYKKRYVLPGGFIPGPKKPKWIDSFLFVGFHHLSGLQKEGLKLWDAGQNIVVTSFPFLALGTADGPGLVHLSGLVGHHGRLGCRLYCGLAGRHKAGVSHYYPALLKPTNYHVKGCDHDDIDINDLPSPSPTLYKDRLELLMSSTSQNQYYKLRLQTGISRPSIFLGLHPRHRLNVPACFGSDIMHLGALNIPDILINLWRGTLDCDKTKDHKSTWDWAVLQGDVWDTHGKTVAAATPHLPGSFDRPPRNPAEKISSGYKAWEFLLYLYGLGPGVFYNVLPKKYYLHFCKLVFAMRIFNQHRIMANDLMEAQEAILHFCQDFEVLYYQRRAERLHFVRPSLHSLTHIGPGVLLAGPSIVSSQWTMERTIGNLVEEIRQPSNPYMNLSKRGLYRCQLNALKSLIPDLDPPKRLVPRGGVDLGEGYVLLRARDTASRALRLPEINAVNSYLQQCGGGRCSSAIRWARLRLPNGQVARSAWKERLKPLTNIRTSRNVKVCNTGTISKV